MANHVTGSDTPSSAPPPCLDELRQQVLAFVLGNPLFAEAEQQRARHFAHACEEEVRLTRWVVNVRAELAHRQAAAARQRRTRATRYLLQRLYPTGFRGHCPPRPQPARAWHPGAPLPYRPDYQAGTIDRRAAALFQPAASLSLAHLQPIRPQ